MLRRRRSAKPVFDVAPGATLDLAPDAVFGAGCRFHVHAGAIVVVGPGVRFGESCVVSAHERVEIGAGCRFADEVTIIDFEPVDADPERPIRQQGLATAPVRIGAGAILDRSACVLAGTTIGPGARVTAHSVVATSAAAS